MDVGEIAALGGLVIAVVVAAISAWSVIRATRKQADAALDAARHQTMVNQEVAVFQIQATLSFNSKQNWIDTLRTEIAELYSELLMLHPMVQKAETLTAERLKRISHLTARIALLLDADQPLHNDLLGALQAPWQNLKFLDQATFSSTIGAVVKRGQLVLKHELEALRRLSEFTVRGELETSDAIVKRKQVRR